MRDKEFHILSGKYKGRLAKVCGHSVSINSFNYRIEVYCEISNKAMTSFLNDNKTLYLDEMKEV